MPATESAPIPAERRRLPSLTFGSFTFDSHSRLLRRGDREVALPPRVVGVLASLLARAGDVVSRQELIDTVWKDAFVTDTSLAEAVSVLRQALDDDAQTPTYIQTLHRRGYRFVAPVSTAPPQEDATAPRPIESAAIAEDVVSPSLGGQLVPWSAALICALMAVAAVWQLTSSRQAVSQAAARFMLMPAAGTAFDGTAPALAFSVRWHRARVVGLRFERVPALRPAARSPGACGHSGYGRRPCAVLLSRRKIDRVLRRRAAEASRACRRRSRDARRCARDSRRGVDRSRDRLRRIAIRRVDARVSTRR